MANEAGYMAFFLVLYLCSLLHLCSNSNDWWLITLQLKSWQADMDYLVSFLRHN